MGLWLIPFLSHSSSPIPLCVWDSGILRLLSPTYFTPSKHFRDKKRSILRWTQLNHPKKHNFFSFSKSRKIESYVGTKREALFDKPNSTIPRSIISLDFRSVGTLNPTVTKGKTPIVRNTSRTTSRTTTINRLPIQNWETFNMQKH